MNNATSAALLRYNDLLRLGYDRAEAARLTVLDFAHLSETNLRERAFHQDDLLSLGYCRTEALRLASL